MPALPRRPRKRADGSRTADRARHSGPAPAQADLEAQYARARLRSQHTLIRATCAFAALFAIVRGTEQVLTGFWHPAQPLALAFVIAVSVILAVIVWTPAFGRIYLPLANVAVPARNAVAAAFLVGAAARGRQEALMFLPLMVIGPFFFLGLGWRAGLVTGIVTFLSFAAAVMVFALDPPTALRAGAFVGMAVVAGAIAGRQLDRVARRDFVESSRISELAQRDALTGLKNRGVFDEQLNALWHRAVDNGCTLAIFLIDVDHFKSFNDRYGHQAGDRTLCKVAEALQSLVERPIDVLTRYGGEEFAAILYGIDAPESEALAERMRCAAKNLPAECREARGSGAVTISIGVGLVEPSDGRQPVGALQLADQALYEAKQRGRDCVVLMDQTAHLLLETGAFDRPSFAREA